jgi:SHS2 domain-containing protein
VYRFVDHTGELQLEVEAASAEQVFAEAVAALGEVLAGEDGGRPARQEVEVEAPDQATLLADFLSELVYLADVERFLPERLASLELSSGRLRATVEGRLGQPSPLVKAVTYHGLELRRKDDGYHARIVFDV